MPAWPIGNRRADLSWEGKLLACYRADGTLALWDLATGQPRGELRTTAAVVVGPVFNPDGTRLAASCADQAIHVWDTATLQELYVLRSHQAVPGSVAFSPDGRLLASADQFDRTVRLWSMTDGRPRAVLGGHAELVGYVFFSPTGDRVFCCERNPSSRVLLAPRPVLPAWTVIFT